MNPQIRIATSILVALFFCSLGATSVLAQEQAEPEKIMLNTIQVKPAMMSEFLDIQREVKNHFQKAGVPFRHVWRTRVFGDAYEFYVVMPISNYAIFDQPHPMTRAIESEAEQMQLLQRYRNTIDGHQRAALVLRPDLSLGVDQEIKDGATAVITTVNVLPGKGTEFANLIKNEVLPAMQKIGQERFWVHQGLFGASPNEWVIVQTIENMAELDKGPPLVRALGAEQAAKIMEQASTMTSDVEFAINSFVGELSY